MNQTINVGTADFAAAGAGYELTSDGIGSCVVICLYDADKKIGALCHVMLPKHPEGSELNPLRFADTALPLVLEKLAEMGSSRDHLAAQLFGGANMFHGLDTFVNRIGEQNVAAVQELLTQQNIHIQRMDVGGTVGRSVTFNVDTGDVQVTTKV